MLRSLALLCSGLCFSCAAATVTLLDGTVREGDALGTALRGRLLTIDGDRLAAADVDWLEFASAVPEGVSVDGHGVLLADGGWLPMTAAPGAAADGQGVAVDSVVGPVVLPLSVIRGWGPAYWLDASQEGDDDRVQLDSGTFDGRVLGIEQGALRFETTLSDEPLLLPLAEIRALRLALPLIKPKGVVFAASLASGRPPLLVALGKDGPVLAAEEMVALQPEQLPRLHMRGGRRHYLSDLVPSEVLEEGAFGVVWPHSIDVGLDGEAISLGGRRFDRGLVLHSKARLSWQLDGGYERFQAVIGIADTVGGEGDCTVRILLDGEERWARTSVRGGQAPERVVIDCSDAKVLTVEVGLGARYDIGDHLVLGDAWLLAVK